MLEDEKKKKTSPKMVISSPEIISDSSVHSLQLIGIWRCQKQFSNSQDVEFLSIIKDLEWSESIMVSETNKSTSKT